jgi:hypothetical protein
MNKLYTAIAAFQQEVPVIHKGTQGYGYSYADLPAIFSIINPLMAKHGLGFTQVGQGTALKTIIFHVESGECLESVFEIPQGVQLSKMNDFQVLGSAITYMRRYALSSALGLVTDKDTDASGEQVKPGIDAELVNKLAKCKDITELQMLYSTKEDWSNAEKTLFTNRKKSLK